ncbi:hypothetical protein M413DRAFT_372051 [Hebeloma cylindrosporum]|uniref:Extracellular membrane protein CFEM domain-containing protein n=1 Tax=Hebeloma cylindrosporum TaxID=76867 RepID=A0A0C3CJM1_HEBCY|nr:hypothetical protein M413DRAFT_372051 [Hebeloma cylindrosporum h7]
MYFRNSLVATLVLVASSVSAAIVQRDIFNELLPRQTTNVCTTTCAPFQSAVDTCTTVGCICTATSARDLQRCVDCAVTASPTSSVIAAAVKLVDTYKETCKGVSLPTVTVAGASGVTSSSTDTAFTDTAFTSTTDSPFTSTTSRSQVVIGPSVTLSATSPGNTSPGVQSSGYAVGVSRGFVVTIGAALGMVLVY